MAFACHIYFIFYFISAFLLSFAYGTCQCNQMLHPGVFSGERMTFAAERNHNQQQKRSNNGGKKSFNMGVISFDPPYLDFGEQPIGMPYVRDVMVFNPSNVKNLELQTLSGDNAHFHASFSKPKGLLPLSNTTFEVIFLARSFGNVENTLFIHTLSGAYPYQVQGYGVQNPYRLRPFLGARIALDHAFYSVINMYNPHDSLLQVTEIYSSGGDLHLELPTGEDDASHKHWQIEPYETKAIIKLSFLGRVASNHTAFIRIRTNKFFAPRHFLILPVEVEVSSVPGIFLSVDQLDFGTLRRMDEPKTIVVSLLNTGNKPVSVTNVSVDPPNKAISIDLKTLTIKHSHQYIKAVAVTYSASNVKSPKQHFGRIVIKTTSKSTPRLEINYQVNVLQGTLAYSVSKTRFLIGSPPYEPVVREIVITNTFTFPLVIHRVVVSSDVQDSLSIVNFSSPITVQEQKTVTPFFIRFLANKSMSTFLSSVRVYTNASIFTIPVHCYDGKLQFRLAESVIEFGTLAVTQKHNKVFEVANLNPVEVTVRQTTSNDSLATLKLLEGDSEPTDIQDEEYSIKPGRVAKFRLDVVVPQVEGDYSGNISLNTTYESKVIMFSLKAASGRIEVDPVKIVFNPSFPGQIQKTPLFLKSTFFNPVNVLSTAVKTEDKHFSFESIKKSNAQLAPHNRQKIGNIIFDPGLVCQPKCYLGVGNEEKAWFASLSLPSDTASVDTSILETSQTTWNSITNKRRNSLNSSLVIDTEAVKNVIASIEGSIVWPSLTSDRPIRFPLTHVGNVSRKTLLLENPADVPVVVQIVPLSVYPNAQSVLDVLSDRFDVDLLTVKPSYHSCFSLPTAKTNRRLSIQQSSEVAPSFDAKIGVETSPDAVSLLIAPRSMAKVPVQFKPENEDQRTSIMFIRNNLTVLDIVTVQGQGARGELMINGKRPSVDSVLLFELKQRHLADCTRKTPDPGGKPNRALTVKKTVLATNPGQLATHVTSFSIDGYECEGYGFKVLDCRPFNLKPTASIKIDIAFTPDFSVSRVSRRLRIKTALGAVFEFSLTATIPSELIPFCAAAAGRPVWEFHVYVSAIAIMFGLLMVVLMMAHFDANKLIATSFSASRPSTPFLNGTHMNGELFDLRKITASPGPPSVSNSLYTDATDTNGSTNVRHPKKEVISPEKTKGKTSSQAIRRSLSNGCDGLISNNNSISNENQENERNRDKVKSIDSSWKESGKKQRKSSSGSQTVKRKDSDSEVPKPIVPSSFRATLETMSDQVFQTEVADSGAISPTYSRESSSSDANSVCCDVPTTLPSKKEKSKVRKKTAKVSPSVINVEEKRSKVKGAEKEKTKTKEKEKSNNALESGKDKKNRHVIDTKEESKEPRKQEVSTKTLRSPKEKGAKTRRISLPVELEHGNGKSKDDRSKSHQSTSASNSTGKTHSQAGKSATSNKKNQISHSNSLPATTRAQKQTSDSAEFSDEISTPHTITEAINSALERTLKQSPTGDSANPKSSSREQSRCSSVSPSPPLSDSSQNLSQSSRSSSYSSVVGSEESASGSNEHCHKRKKQHSKAPKPSPLTIQKNTSTPLTTDPFASISQPNAEISNGLTSKPWPSMWDSSPGEAKEVSESFPPVSTSSSLFASTPFDKDGKLESARSTTAEPFSEECRQSSSGEKFPLYTTFHDVKAPGLSTPFVEADTSVQKFWPDGPMQSLESLIPNLKQPRNTNWVNFLDESSSGGPNLPSPGMPQSSKTVAEIWDAGQSHDENDGWSTAFSPLESELSSPGFSPYDTPYETAWSTGPYQNDYYAVSTESSWSGANQGSESEYRYPTNESVQFSSSSRKLNPYSQPWDASGRANKNRWSHGPAYRE